MTPDEEFEKWWHDHGVHHHTGAMNAAWKEVGRNTYIAGSTNATKRTAERCVEIFQGHDRGIAIRIIKKEFL